MLLKYESIKSKIDKTNAGLKTKSSKTREEEAEKRITELNIKLEEFNNELEEEMKHEVKVNKIKSYVCLAPTNLAELIIDGMAIHKFACLIKKYEVFISMAFKYIFVDEVSMLQEKIYKFLLMIKKVKPHVKFIISGDYNQLKPVADRISPDYNYSRKPAIYELCNFNQVKSTKCRRADDTLFNLIKFDNIPNLTPTDFKMSSHITEYDVHLCYTNKLRIRINTALMNYKSFGYKGPKLEFN